MLPAALDGEMKASEGSAIERVEVELRNLSSAATRFQGGVPRGARAMVGRGTTVTWAHFEREPTGLKAREAPAGVHDGDRRALSAASPDPDDAKVNLRLGAVIAMLLPALGEMRAHPRRWATTPRRRWRSCGASRRAPQKEAEPLTRADARSFVFHVAM
jgi:hypothetical protein